MLLAFESQNSYKNLLDTCKIDVRHILAGESLGHGKTVHDLLRFTCDTSTTSVIPTHKSVASEISVTLATKENRFREKFQRCLYHHHFDSI